MTKVFIGIIIFAVLFGLFYLFGFIHAFRNHGEMNFPRSLKSYDFTLTKAEVEKKMDELVNDPAQSLSLDTSNPYFVHDWISLFIENPADTVEYVFRFGGDSTSWVNDTLSNIVLFSIHTRGEDIDHKSLGSVRKKEYRRYIEQFESAFIHVIQPPGR
jgi:hypothetical protein